MKLEIKQKISQSLTGRNKGKPLPEGMKLRIKHIFVDGIESKTCPRCNIIKSISEFGKNKYARNGTGLEYHCKTCHNKQRSDYYHNNEEYRNTENKKRTNLQRTFKILAIKYLGSECLDCRIKYKSDINEFIFDFHHRDPKQKDFAISEYRANNFETIKLELDKCDLLCSNCHRLRHQKEWRVNGRSK